ncbi:CAP domain-containing protein [Oligoflexus tunisiensis]|uniref:CAP domain-containing protein n=1 Tax=Oligoflexus tunisiensis TaxID=708132 RepID=UPI00114CD754|nr:CAP domain-containing protein [Oligoflexus tunisiensis]
MKRLSLITFTILLILGCQRSNANPLDPNLRNAPENEDSTAYTRLTSCYEGDEWVCAVEAAIVEKTNQKRAGIVAALTHSFEASYAARVHSLHMASVDDSFNHNGFPDSRELTIKQEFPGLKISMRGENIAMFSNGLTDPEDAAEEFVQMWWNSKGHRDNMLRDGIHYIGVGVARSPKGIYATQLFH